MLMRNVVKQNAENLVQNNFIITVGWSNNQIVIQGIWDFSKLQIVIEKKHVKYSKYTLLLWKQHLFTQYYKVKCNNTAGSINKDQHLNNGTYICMYSYIKQNEASRYVYICVYIYLLYNI